MVNKLRIKSFAKLTNNGTIRKFHVDIPVEITDVVREYDGVVGDIDYIRLPKRYRGKYTLRIVFARINNMYMVASILARGNHPWSLESGSDSDGFYGCCTGSISYDTICIRNNKELVVAVQRIVDAYSQVSVSQLYICDNAFYRDVYTYVKSRSEWKENWVVDSDV